MGCFNHKYFTNIQFTAGSHLCVGKGTEETSLWLYVIAAASELPVNLDESKSSLLLEWESSNEPVLPLFKSLSPFKVKCNCPGHVSCSFLQSESSLLSNVGLLWPPIFPSTVSTTESEKKVSFRGGHAESCSNRCCSLL